MESHCCHHGLLIQIHGGASVRVCIHQKWLKYVLIKEVWLFVSPLYLPFSPPIIFFPHLLSTDIKTITRLLLLHRMCKTCSNRDLTYFVGPSA